MTRIERLELIRTIEEARQSHLVVYFCGDRHPVGSQIAEDAVRVLYDHLVANEERKRRRIDLFLYSIGGRIEIPWRIVSMFREFGEEFCVLIPYKAHSATTMIALGADEIVMGKKGELGPIDPQLEVEIRQPDGTTVRQRIPVVDVMSYMSFVRERAGLSDQSALANSVNILAEKIHPLGVGSAFSGDSHVRLAAKKLLESKKKPPTEQQISVIIDTLAQRMYYHGHGIGRAEARDLGLDIERPEVTLERVMWNLFVAYEELLHLREPLDPRSAFENEYIDDYVEKDYAVACIESLSRLDIHKGELKIRRARQLPQPLNLSLNLPISFPPGVDPRSVPPEAMQNLLRELSGRVAEMVRKEVAIRAPIRGVEAHLENARWQEVT